MPTYTPLQSIELTSASASVTFSGIPQTYQDLVVVLFVRGTTATNDIDVSATFNGDTASNYSNTRIFATGSTSGGQRGSNLAYLRLGNMAGSGSYSSYTPIILNIQNYSNTTTHKTTLGRSSNPDRIVDEYVNLWRSTAAVTSIKIEGSSNFDTGCTFDLYGISPVAANNAQAFGGTDIYYDSTYVYHVFKVSGTFTPYRNLTADMLVVAGGGGGGAGQQGNHYGAGGGAGGFRTFTSQSLTANTNYAVTIGAGGAGGNAAAANRGNNGTSSQFGSLTAPTGGGGGGSESLTGNAGGSGGGGGGFVSNVNGGAGTAGEGNAGGTGIASYMAGGGGGAGAVGNNGNNPTSGNGGNGGIGSSSAISGGSVTGAGELDGGTYYFAGGGGGTPRDTGGIGGLGGGGNGNNASASADVLAAQGTTNTGGGGGGGNAQPAPGGTGGSGGSGIVIVRYAR